jgi:hypothetical protein
LGRAPCPDPQRRLIRASVDHLVEHVDGDLLESKHIVCRIGRTRRYEPLASGLRAMTALVVLRNKAIKPLLAAARPLHPVRGAHNPKPIDAHYNALQLAMHGVFHELGIAA